MNRLKTVLLFTLAGLVVACSYNELPEHLSPLPTKEEWLVRDVETRAETYKEHILDEEYFVTAEDLNNYVKHQRNTIGRSNLTVNEVKSYGFDTSHTLFYILNYNDGWEIVSADKRIQPSLAHGDNGKFTMDCNNEPMKFWMNMVADRILQTRLGNSPKDDDITTASADSKRTPNEHLDNYTAFWNTISPPTNREQTRLEPLVPTPGPLVPIDSIYRYEIDSEIVTTLTERVPYLLNTKWGQSHPWNQYCPLISEDSSTRAPAGCLPVAGAQLLYYLETEKGWPLRSPGNASCSGTIDSYAMGFGSFNTLIWDSMAQNNSSSFSDSSKLHVAKLIAYVGEVIDVIYGDEESGSVANYNTFLQNMQQSFNMSIECNYALDSTTVLTSLRDAMPVTVAANAPGASVGHMWLIDGFEIYSKVTTHYIATFDTPKTPEFLAMLDKNDADYSYTTTFSSVKFHMNWGWNGYQNGLFNWNPLEWTINTNDGTTTYSDVFYVLYGYVKN